MHGSYKLHASGSSAKGAGALRLMLAAAIRRMERPCPAAGMPLKTDQSEDTPGLKRVKQALGGAEARAGQAWEHLLQAATQPVQQANAVHSSAAHKQPGRIDLAVQPGKSPADLSSEHVNAKRAHAEDPPGQSGPHCPVSGPRQQQPVLGPESWPGECEPASAVDHCQPLRPKAIKACRPVPAFEFAHEALRRLRGPAPGVSDSPTSDEQPAGQLPEDQDRASKPSPASSLVAAGPQAAGEAQSVLYQTRTLEGPGVAADVVQLRQQAVQQQEQLQALQLQLEAAVQAEHLRWRSTFEALVAEVRERWQGCQQVLLAQQAELVQLREAKALMQIDLVMMQASVMSANPLGPTGGPTSAGELAGQSAQPLQLLQQPPWSSLAFSAATQHDLLSLQHGPQGTAVRQAQESLKAGPVPGGHAPLQQLCRAAAADPRQNPTSAPRRGDRQGVREATQGPVQPRALAEAGLDQGAAALRRQTGVAGRQSPQPTPQLTPRGTPHGSPCAPQVPIRVEARHPGRNNAAQRGFRPVAASARPVVPAKRSLHCMRGQGE